MPCALTEREKGCLFVRNKRPDLRGTDTQQVHDLARRPVPKRYAHHLRRRSMQDAEPVKVVVLGQEYKTFRRCPRPEDVVGSAAESRVEDMGRARKLARERTDQIRRQVLV